MKHIVIVDNEEKDRKNLIECINFVTEQNGLQVAITEYRSAEDFLSHYSFDCDIVFMDIELDDTNGIEAARRLRKIDRSVVLVFVTKMAQLAVKGYEVDALDFIVKPIDRNAFALKMQRALSRAVSGREDRIMISSDGEITSIRIHLIKYLEVQGHYTIYHSQEGIFSECITLTKAKQKLGDNPNFACCNRSYYVNMQYIDGIKKDVCIVGGDELLISRPQRSKFLLAYAQYLGGK